MMEDRSLTVTVRLRQLYEINKVLVRFEDVERTLPEIMALVTVALPLRSAVAVRGRQGRATVWGLPGDDPARAVRVLERAREAFGYLRGVRDEGGAEADGAAAETHALPHPGGALPPALDEHRFVALPLAVTGRAVFGLLQVEALSALDELDLMFLDALVAQLSIAMDRQAAVQAQRAIAEERRAAAVRAEDEQRFLADIGKRLGVSLDYRATLAAVARLAVPWIADLCFIDEVVGAVETDGAEHPARADGTGEVQRLEVAHATPELAELAWRIREHAPLPVPAGAVERLVVADRPHAWELRPGDETARFASGPDEELLRELGLASMMVVPLLARGRPLGTLVFLDATARPRSRDELAFAAEIGRRASFAIDNARLYEVAQRSIRAREHVLGVVSHDLRTPLASILLTADVLLRRLSGGPEGKQLETLRRSAKHMERLIGDLLQTAAIDAGRLAVERRPQAAAELVGAAVALLGPLARDRAIDLEAAPVGREVAVVCDRERVLEVFSNLVGNALKFTEPGGSIRVSVQPLEREVRFSVADTGPGIDPAALSHVFDRFWQARKGARPGIGLGLAIARGIVEALGGRIWAESEVGRGSTFHFTLPRAEPHEASRTSHGGGEPHGAQP